MIEKLIKKDFGIWGSKKLALINSRRRKKKMLLEQQKIKKIRIISVLLYE